MAYFGADGPVAGRCHPTGGLLGAATSGGHRRAPAPSSPSGGHAGPPEEGPRGRAWSPTIGSTARPVGEMWVQQHQAGFTGLRRAHRLVQHASCSRRPTKPSVVT
jgi:hypothetical protein